MNKLSLDTILHEVTLQQISAINIPQLTQYARENHETLTFLYKRGIITDKDIETALQKAVLAQAGRDYMSLTVNHIPIERVESPECLAYALRDVFPSTHVKRIRFPEGRSHVRYILDNCPKNILAKYRQELLHPIPIHPEEISIAEG